MKDKPTPSGLVQDKGFLEGQLLIAMPSMSDHRFARSVIYMCAHSSEGAMGLIINQRADNLTVPELLQQLEIVDDELEDQIPPGLFGQTVHIGGPVEMGRGFVLHTSDYSLDGATTVIDDGICLTATVEILKAMANGEGPNRSLLALGYSGWAPGQLESEITANGWLHCAAEPDLIFGDDLELKYDRALSTLGVDPSHLVADCGHA